MNESLKRLLSGTVYVALLLIAISYSVTSFQILFGVFLFIAIYEFCKLIHLNYVLPLFIGTSIYSLGVYYKMNQVSNLFLLVFTLIVSIKCLHFLFFSNKTQIDTFSKYLFLLGYIIFPFLIITKIPLGKYGYNPKIMISIFILIWTNDTFAYIVGKSLGKNKLYEKISPKKTIEGFLGGLVFSILASLIVSKFFIQGSLFIWLIIAIIISFIGTIGDLIESKFKRIAGVKDSGTIMPGHGGILDRLDSIIFVIPFVYLFYQILYYVS